MQIHTFCPIDGTDDADVEVYPANWDVSKLAPSIFSARRLPDRIHYRIVRNTRTGCVRSDPVLDEGTVLSLYRQSDVTYEGIRDFTVQTYVAGLERALRLLPDRRGALEIGCGDGCFLERLLTMGFRLVRGVEPSERAMAKATLAVRRCMVNGVLGPDTFDREAFSLICGFQVLDHLLRPNDVLQQCWRLLAAGGVMYWICHDIGWWMQRLLGRSCPIIDIEHAVLFDRRTVRRLFENNGFDVAEVAGVRNRYPLEYWLHLAPAPRPLKAAIRQVLAITGLGRVTLTVNPGNLSIVARKPSL